jgi:small subunit ribosomal protein S8
MSMTDPISDMLTRIRNASKAKHKAVDVPASRLKREIARILKEHLYIRDYVELPDNKQGIVRIYLKYSREDKPIIHGLRRMSRPGLRRYVSADEAWRYAIGRQGIMILSTSSGVITNQEAVEKKVGGEAVCAVW